MVSVYRNPPPNQDFSQFHSIYMTGDPIKVPPLYRGDSNMLPMVPPAITVDDPNKKIRKPYTITKSRESWSEQEHDKFLEALQLFDRDWKKIEAFVGSKTVIQIRSHAQKYFLKVQKNGTSEHVPPPRPKRKAAHPYPQKASKSALPRSIGPVQSSAARVETGYAVGNDSFSIPRDPIGSATLSSWSYNVVPTESLPHVPKDDVVLANVANNYSSSSSDSTPCLWASNETTEVKARQCNTTRVIPDFSQVYRFIGSIFDPTTTNHMQRLRKMEPINVETVLMLMKNLCVNLASPEFEDHRKLLSSYKVGSENVHAGSGIPST